MATTYCCVQLYNLIYTLIVIQFHFFGLFKKKKKYGGSYFQAYWNFQWAKMYTGEYIFY